MCCEKGNYTYIAYATNEEGENFSLQRSSAGIRRSYQAIYTSNEELDTGDSVFPNYFYGRWYSIESGNFVGYFSQDSKSEANRTTGRNNLRVPLIIRGLSDDPNELDFSATFPGLQLQSGDTYFRQNLNLVKEYYVCFVERDEDDEIVSTSWFKIPTVKNDTVIIEGREYKFQKRFDNTESTLQAGDIALNVWENNQKLIPIMEYLGTGTGESFSDWKPKGNAILFL